MVPKVVYFITSKGILGANVSTGDAVKMIEEFVN